MDIKLIFAVIFLVLFIILFFFGANELRRDFDKLIEKGILYCSVTVKSYLYLIVLLFILVLCLFILVGYFLFSQHNGCGSLSFNSTERSLNMPKFAKNEFSADFLWRLIADEEKVAAYNSVDMEALFQALFPGIKVPYMYKHEILIKHVVPVLQEQFPKLRSSPSLEDAKKQYGKIIKVEEERKCDGYEWIDWDLVQSH